MCRDGTCKWDDKAARSTQMVPFNHKLFGWYIILSKCIVCVYVCVCVCVHTYVYYSQCMNKWARLHVQVLCRKCYNFQVCRQHSYTLIQSLFFLPAYKHKQHHIIVIILMFCQLHRATFRSKWKHTAWTCTFLLVKALIQWCKYVSNFCHVDLLFG